MNRGKRLLRKGLLLLAMFAAWTVLIQVVDVRPGGQTGRPVGFATVNEWFHTLTGVHLWLYTLTDWAGLVPVFVCLFFGTMGLVQLLGRRSLWKVDGDIVLLGIYYGVVILGYLIFEMVPINYRPIFIAGRLEASYPSSTTLLVLCIMPTLAFQAKRRMQNVRVVQGITWGSTAFSAAMVLGRLVCGVHWLTDILGAGLLSGGLFCLYRAAVTIMTGEGFRWNSMKNFRN